MDLRYFKCNVIGGFRLSDINKNIKQGEYFYLDDQITNTSRACIAALKNNLMIEVTEKEASKFIEIPKGNKKIKVDQKISNRSNSLGTSVHNASITNKSLESRQASKTHGVDDVATPKFNVAERNIRNRNNDRIDDENDTDKVIKSPVTAKKEKVEREKKLKRVEEQKNKKNKIKLISSLDSETEKKSEVIVKLSNDENDDLKIADEVLPVPTKITELSKEADEQNDIEKTNDDIKDEIKKDINKRIIRRRRRDQEEQKNNEE